MANIAITAETRRKVAYVKKPDEFLRDTIARLVDDEIKRESITVPPANTK